MIRSLIFLVFMLNSCENNENYNDLEYRYGKIFLEEKSYTGCTYQEKESGKIDCKRWFKNGIEYYRETYGYQGEIITQTYSEIKCEVENEFIVIESTEIEGEYETIFTKIILNCSRKETILSVDSIRSMLPNKYKVLDITSDKLELCM